MTRAKVKALISEVKDVLWSRWDPIGLNNEYSCERNDSASHDDEYDSYAPQIAKMLMQKADKTKIARQLSNVAEVSMGLSPNRDHDLKVASILIELVNTREPQDAH